MVFEGDVEIYVELRARNPLLAFGEPVARLLLDVVGISGDSALQVELRLLVLLLELSVQTGGLLALGLIEGFLAGGPAVMLARKARGEVVFDVLLPQLLYLPRQALDIIVSLFERIIATES